MLVSGLRCFHGQAQSVKLRFHHSGIADDNIDEAIKYWVEHDVLPGREQQKADAQNEP